MLKDAEWIFFDMGYTLINEDQAHFARMADTLGELNEQQIADFWQLVDECARAGKRAPIPSAIRQMCNLRHVPHYSRELEETFPYSAAVLAELHKYFRIGIIANQTGGSVKRLRRFGLLDSIDCVYSSDEIGKFKPSPEFFRSAIRAVGAEPQKCIMVGDRPDNDIAPAREAGMLTVRVRCGGFRAFEPEEPAWIADADLPDIRGLIPLLCE